MVALGFLTVIHTDQCHFCRLVFSRFFIFAEISEMLKKNQLEKLVSPVK